MSKVVHLTSVHNPFDNRLFNKECKTLKGVGYNIILIAPHIKDEIVDNILIKAVKKPKTKRERFQKTIYEVYSRAKEQKADLYHIHDPELLPVGLLLKIKGYKVIFDMHENVPKSFQDKEWISPFISKTIKFFYRRVERLVLKKVGVIFAEKSYENDYKWLNNTVTVLNYPKVEQILTIRSKKNKNFSAGYIGDLTKLRGSSTMVEVLSKLKARDIDVSFECVGEGPESEVNEMKEKAKQYEIDARFHGFKPSVEGLQIISRCHVGLALLRDIPNHRNSYPTKIFEYMALGIPVITSDFPLYKSIVEENECGFCVVPDDVETIASTLEYLLNNTDEAKKIGEKGKETVKRKYNWKHEGQKLVDFYEKILSA